MSPEKVARSARGDIDLDLLTGVGSAGFLSKGYFQDTGLINKLDEGEQLQYLTQNLNKGLLFTQGGEGKNIKPGSKYRSGLLVTDKRIVMVVGGGNDDGSDWTHSIDYDELNQVTVSTGLLKHSLGFTSKSGQYKFYTKIKHDVEAISEYIQTQINLCREPRGSETRDTEASQEGKEPSTSKDIPDSTGADSTGSNTTEKPVNSTSRSEQSTTDVQNRTLPDPSPIGRKMYAYSKGDDTTAINRETGGSDSSKTTQETANTRTKRSETPAGDPHSGSTSNSAEKPKQTESGQTPASSKNDDVSSISDAMYSYTPPEANNSTGNGEKSESVTGETSQNRPTQLTTISVRDPYGLPIQRASLEIEGIDRKISGETDKTGKKSVTLPARNDHVDIEISKQGYEPLKRRVPFTADSTINVILEPAEQANTRTIQLLVQSPSSKDPQGDTICVTAGSVETTESIHAGGRQAFEVPETSDSITIEILQGESTIFEDEQEIQENSVYEVVVPEPEDQSNQSDTSITDTEREDMFAELRRLEEEESRKLTRGLARSKGEYNPEEYEEEFGTWSAAKEKMDTRTGNEDSTSDTGKAPKDAPSKARLFLAFKELRETRNRPISIGAIPEHTPYEPEDYVAQFGTWKAAVKKLEATVESDSIPDFGQTDPDPETPSKVELLADFKRVIDKSRRTSAPTKGLVRAHGDHDPEVYEAQFGTWSNAKAILNSLRDEEAYADLPSGSSKSDQNDDSTEMGSSTSDPIESDSTEIREESRNRGKYTRADLLSEIQRIREKVGGRPSTTDFDEHAAMSVAVPYNFFDSWDEAVAAASEQSDSGISSADKRSMQGSTGKETSQSDTSQTGMDESDTIDGESESIPDLSTLQGRNEGRIDELVLRVDDVIWVRDNYYTAHLTVSSADLDDITFEIWAKHDIDVEFESGQVYQFNQARLKVWGDPKENDMKLSSTRSMVVTLPGESQNPTEAGPGSPSGSESSGTTSVNEDDSTETNDQEEDIVDDIMGDIDI